MGNNVDSATAIRQLYLLAESSLGAQHWWPAETAFEVVVGAFLTQNTAWSNVEKALEALRSAGVLSINGIRQTPIEKLEELVRPAGFFRQKATRLKAFVSHLDRHYQGSLPAMLSRALPELREELLGLKGVGPETADSILLYAGSREVFVVDAYTRRIFSRHGLASDGEDYDAIRRRVEAALASIEATVPQELNSIAEVWRARHPQPPHLATTHRPSGASQLPRSELARRYNELHALLVQLAKHYCRKQIARCEQCPLQPLLPKSAVLGAE